MERIKKIVFVCTGNTDRSPMALAVARREAKVRNMCIELDSCGAFADSGHSAKREAVRACAEAGLDISDHISKTIFDIEDSCDTLYAVMEKEHITRLQNVKSIPAERLLLLGGGIEQKGLHSLRHTFATNLVNGVKQADGTIRALSPRQVADILGHSTSQITELYYVKKDTSRLNGVTDGFDF